MMTKINIDLGDASYPILIDSGLVLEKEKFHKSLSKIANTYIIIDDFVFKMLGTEFFCTLTNCNVFTVSAGKNNKTLYSAMKIFQNMDDLNISRDATIVAIGGGVVGDLAGFVASCWYRGVKLIHVPTTLLSAVDSCLGGKTAINFRHTVNAIGSYHHPEKVIIDTSILSSLTSREISSGFGEIIKYGVIGAGEILDLLERFGCTMDADLGKIVELCLKEKEKYVRGDIKETANRLYLNFGHTIGHAIEFSTIYEGKETLRHGEGVALGMLAIFRICVELGFLKQSDLDFLKKLLQKYGLPVTFNSEKIGMNRNSLIQQTVDLTFKDKKRLKQSLRMVVLEKIGKPKIYLTNSKSLIRKGVEEIIL